MINKWLRPFVALSLVATMAFAVGFYFVSGSAMAQGVVEMDDDDDINDAPDVPLTGDVYDQATQAALDHLGGGTVLETEVEDDEGAYEVEVRATDGLIYEVQLDENFNVLSSSLDD